MTSRKLHWIAHPFLFAVYGVLSLLANNVNQVGLVGLRALLVVLVGSILVMILFRLALRDPQKAGLASSGAILLILAFGHVQSLTQAWSIGGIMIGGTAALLIAWIGLFGLWLFWVIKRARQPALISGYLNWVGLILVIFPVFTLFVQNRQEARVEPWIMKYLEQAWQEAGVSKLRVQSEAGHESQPDVYYIVLDSYTRQDILESHFEYDNSEFIQALKDRGFYVADDSRSNYTDTNLSLASTLNMAHLDSAPGYFRQHAHTDQDWATYRAADELIWRSRVFETFKSLGYTTISFDSGYEKTSIRLIDEPVGLLESEAPEMKETLFELMLLDTSLGRIYTRLQGQNSATQAMFRMHRERVLFTLDNLPEYALRPGSYFVYAHIISPHTPYVFGPNGEEIQSDDPYTLMDAHPGQAENLRYYRDQVHYLNGRVLETLDRILAESDTPPVILLQGDHGAKVFSGPEPTFEQRLDLLFPILNAYYFSGKPVTDLYPDITPVNSFRLVFNLYFDSRLPLLADNSYFLEKTRGSWKFTDVCKSYPVCSHP